MLKQVLAVAVVGLLAAGSASAHDSNWGRRYAPAYQHYPHYYYPYRYAPIRYAPRYCPPVRPWGWHNGYYDQYPRGYDRNDWHGDRGDGQRYDGHRGDGRGSDWNRRDDDGDRNDWDRHH